MRKTILLAGLILILATVIASAEVPTANRMKLGDISDVLPAVEMKEYYLKMEPIMLKYFGPPFSDITLKMEADPTKDMHSTGFKLGKQTLLLAGQAQQYVQNKESNPQFALNNIYGAMRHELSHGMYLYGNNMFSFDKQWPWEGWAKVLENHLITEIDGETLSGLGDTYCYYMDEEIIGGTEGWGGSKQTANHGNIYGVVGGVHMLLFYTASSSFSDLDFYQKLNNALYDYISSKNKNSISLEEYKAVIKPLLSGIKIDGQDAWTWYFDNPAAFSNGNLGIHLNAYASNDNQYFRPVRLNAYVFDRQESEKGKIEQGLANQQIKVTLKDSSGAEIFSNYLVTDAEGNGLIDIIKEEVTWEPGAYSVIGEANVNNKLYTSNYFMIDSPKVKVDNNYIYGVLLDSDKKLLPGKYVGLLTADVPFIFKKDGLFIIDVPETQKIVKLNFLGQEQEVTKAPFARVFAFIIPDDYLDLAAGKSATELEAGIIEVSEELLKQDAPLPTGKPVGDPLDQLDQPAAEPNTNKGCGDGICDDFEVKTHGCAKDCNWEDVPGPMGQMEPVGKIGKVEKVEQAGPINPSEEQPGFFTRIINWFRNLLRGSSELEENGSTEDSDHPWGQKPEGVE